MRRAFKHSTSEIVVNDLKYKESNKNNNKKIADILYKEQKNICAYTDEYISRTDAKDIEHFDPALKNTEKDNYNNWFLVKHQWNKEKSYKWDMFQPILHPTAIDFEERIVYTSGDYIVSANTDEQAINLLKLLQLDDAVLAENRKKYIARKREEIKVFQEEPITFFATLASQNPCQISYLRAIKEEFGIDVYEMLP